MCGRFAQVVKHKQLKKLIDELDIKNRTEQIEINFNVAPTQAVSAVIAKEEGRILTHFRWGLIPSWSKESTTEYKMINVRSETVLEKPTFKRALLYRRCLIPATGFYEWRKTDKQPFFVHAAQEDYLLFAGLTEYWKGADGSEIQSCAILTTDANELMEPIHNRMPVILSADAWDIWLNSRFKDEYALQALLKPCPVEILQLYPVSKLVNSVKANGEDCLKPLEN